LDDLLTKSLGAGEHLRSIVTEGERTLDAAQTAAGQLRTAVCISSHIGHTDIPWSVQWPSAWSR
jgi:hypothetical protein